MPGVLPFGFPPGGIFGPVPFGGLGGNPVLNPSFEIAGVSPGLAASWTPTITFNGYPIADFADPGYKPVEDFTGASWGTVPFVYLVTTGTASTFDVGLVLHPNAVESFGHWVGLAGWVAAVTTGTDANFPGSVESFDDGSWGTYPWVTDAGAGSPTHSFTESFEPPTWGTWSTSVTSGTSATFDNGSHTLEDFESIAPDLLFVPDPSTSVCTTPGGPHGKANGYKVTVYSTGAEPSGLAANLVYYFVNVPGGAATTFQLSKTIGGAPVTISDVGSGSIYAHADESVYWTST